MHYEATGDEYDDAARVSGQVFQSVRAPLMTRRVSMRMDMRQEGEVTHDPDAEHKRFVETWMYAKVSERGRASEGGRSGAVGGQRPRRCQC